jgi:iron complex transport system substrate-binding protein
LQLCVRGSRRGFVAAASALALGSVGPARARQETATPSTGADGEWTFTDDAGVDIALARRPERIVAYLPLAASLWDFGVHPVGVYGTTRRPDGTPEVYDGAVDLDTVESIGETYGEMDLEQLISLQPELIVNEMWDMPPDVWGLQPETVEQVKRIAPIASIRFVEQPIAATLARVDELAVALGADLEDPEIVAAKERYETANDDLAAAIAEKPGLTAIFVSGTPESSFWVASPKEFSDLITFNELGLDIVQPEAGDEWWEELSWEQAAKYPADLLLVDARSGSLTGPELAAQVPTFAALPAARAGQFSAWQTEYVPSYAGVAAVLEDLAATIRDMKTDVV